MSATEIVTLTQKFTAVNTLSARKKIIAIWKYKNILIFQVNFEKVRKTLKSNDHWIKSVTESVVLRQKWAEILIYEVRIKKISKNMTKELKTIKNACARAHSRLKVDKTKWLRRNSNKKKYTSLIIWVNSAEMINRLIQWRISIESNIKTMKLYDKKIRIKQCLKCQKYEHLTYECKNNQRCAHCAQDHHTEACSSKNDEKN